MRRLFQRLGQDTFGLVPEGSAGKPGHVYNNFTLTELRRRISQFAPVTLTADTSGLTGSETEVLGLLIEASRYLDPVFNRQSYTRYEERREELLRQAR